MRADRRDARPSSNGEPTWEDRQPEIMPFRTTQRTARRLGSIARALGVTPNALVDLAVEELLRTAHHLRKTGPDKVEITPEAQREGTIHVQV